MGDKVTVEPQIVCGKCYPCRHGKYNLCEELKVMGFQDVGMASEYFVVDAAKVTPLPQEMTYEQGAMIEPLAVAVHGVKQFGDMKGMKVAVLGAGPIGNLVAQTAKGMGAERVMITDVSESRLELAKQCGIDVAVFADMATVDLAVANDHELDIKSTMMYRHEDYVDAIQLVDEKKVILEPLITKVFPFAQYKDAYEYIENNCEKAMKIIVNV